MKTDNIIGVQADKHLTSFCNLLSSSHSRDTFAIYFATKCNGMKQRARIQQRLSEYQLPSTVEIAAVAKEAISSVLQSCWDESAKSFL